MYTCVDCLAPAVIWDGGIPLCLNCTNARDAAWHPPKKPDTFERLPEEQNSKVRLRGQVRGINSPRDTRSRAS
jgi:hypothetical protein